VSKLVCKLEGVRGRKIAVYDNKCVINTDATLGSLLTNNALDGEKTIFYIDVVGVQFKVSGLAIGYLQLETPSMQMNNQASNMFSENTFTFEENKNGITNELMEQVRDYILSRIEGYKYGTIQQLPQEIPEKLQALLCDMHKQEPQAPSSLPAYGVREEERWVCPSCGAKNLPTKAKCYKCGKAK